ncbi:MULTISPECIES: type II toxin-antitoxin system VapC family toxin [unclassified Pseudomonas]|uniref:type II toxin-antitoxin system VapC family toxin n=1 Tax=unclassified Pseudomonas TaxID=196821 RepID=UPI000BE39C7D|nr:MULTISPECIES: type II toxin-antitoxin system VapC family toxin [unclassified Pseudomonas]
MKIVIDTNVLVQIMQNESSTDLHHPETGEVVDRLFERAAALVEHVDTVGGLVVLPAPVLSEYLFGVARQSFQSHIDVINSVKSIEVAPFDQLAAIECAMLVSDAEQKEMDPDATKAKLRVDRQILAIAVAAGVSEIWTHDKGLMKKAKSVGLSVKCLADIGPPPLQYRLDPKI